VRRELPSWARGVIGFGVVLLCFEAATRGGLLNPNAFPPVSLVLLRVAELAVDPAFLRQVWSTLGGWAIGLGVAVLIAVPIGILLGSSNFTYAGSRAFIEFLRPIPSVALIPLAILLFGRDVQAKATLATYASIWPILFNTVYGMHDVDPVAKDTARSFGFGRLSILTRVSLPSALPFIYTGIRIAAAIALIVVISAELLGAARNGIGAWLMVARSALRPDLVFAGTIVTGMLGWAINWATVTAERRLLGWQPALRESS
jgi:NitT/TauT family transport system permease protein